MFLGPGPETSIDALRRREGFAMSPVAATGSQYSTAVTSFNLGEAAARGGVSADELRQLVALGIVTPGPYDRFTSGDVRRISMVHSVAAAGVPLDGLGAAVRSDQIPPLCIWVDVKSFVPGFTRRIITSGGDRGRVGHVR